MRQGNGPRNWIEIDWIEIDASLLGMPIRMPFHITCVCGRLTVAPDDASGHSIRCSRCDRELDVPGVAAPQPPPAPPPLATPEPEIVIHIDETLRRRVVLSRDAHGVHLLAAAMALLGLLSVIPVILTMINPGPDPAISLQANPTTEPWAMAILLAAILHLVYMLYLIQLPDWSGVWVVSLFLLLTTTLYATVLGIRLLASPNNLVMQLLALDGNQFSSNQEVGWCLIMILVTGTVSYLAGRFGMQWRQRSGE